MTGRFILIAAFALAALAPSARAQQPSSETQEVIAEVLQTDGVLTEDMHRRFWDAQRRIAPPGGEQEVATMMLSNLVISQEYQHEMWESIRVSYNRERAVKSDRLVELRCMLLSEFEKSLPWPEGSPDYVAAMSAYQAGLKDGDLAEGVEIRAIGEPSAELSDKRMKVERLFLGKQEYILYPNRD